MIAQLVQGYSQCLEKITCHGFPGNIIARGKDKFDLSCTPQFAKFEKLGHLQNHNCLKLLKSKGHKSVDSKSIKMKLYLVLYHFNIELPVNTSSISARIRNVQKTLKSRNFSKFKGHNSAESKSIEAKLSYLYATTGTQPKPAQDLQPQDPEGAGRSEN